MLVEARVSIARSATGSATNASTRTGRRIVSSSVPFRARIRRRDAQRDLQYHASPGGLQNLQHEQLRGPTNLNVALLSSRTSES